MIPKNNEKIENHVATDVEGKASSGDRHRS